MVQPVTSLQKYRVEIPVFSGPLDLLLHLIERAELDITKVALAQVTDQYLAHLQAMQERSPDDVSSFLVIASKLIQIKSEALLPRPPDREEGEEDPAEALAEQLRIYKRFKDLSKWLSGRQEAGLRTYVRLAPPPKVDARLEMDGLGLADLVSSAVEAYSRQTDLQEVGRVHVAERVTVREKIALIVRALRSGGRASFMALLGKARNRVEIVVTFLAVLELVKRHRISATQSGLFQEIELVPAETWEKGAEFDLEFED